MRHYIAPALLLLAVPALAQDVSGAARAADGDSLDFGAISVRLHGIDAPEVSQICERADGNWACGKAAAAKLIALPDFSDRYIAQEARSKTARLGLWAGAFQMPADYRAAHPRTVPRDAPRQRASIPSPAPRAGASTTYFRNCKEAWAAGAAPLHRGQPEYRPEMDGDGDGIACEPYGGR